MSLGLPPERQTISAHLLDPIRPVISFSFSAFANGRGEKKNPLRLPTVQLLKMPQDGPVLKRTAMKAQ